MKTSACHLSVVREGGTLDKIPTESSWSSSWMVVWRRVRNPETTELPQESFCCNLGNPHFYNLSIPMRMDGWWWARMGQTLVDGKGQSIFWSGESWSYGSQAKSGGSGYVRARAVKPQHQVLRAEERPLEDASSESDSRKVAITGSVQGQVRNATSRVAWWLETRLGHCRGSTPRWGTEILHAMWHG